MTRFAPILLAALVAVPAIAGDREASLFYDSAPGRSGNISNGSSTTTLESKRFSGFGLRFGTTIAKIGPADLSMDATWRVKSKADLNVNGAAFGEYEWGYLAAGAMVNWHLPVDIGAGLDLRAVTSTLIEEAPSGEQRIGVQHFSPWIRAQVGYTFPTGPVKPFVRLEAAYDLSSQGDYSYNSSSTDANKAYGVVMPKSEISLHVGIRF
ncbi:MAG TPA: hypothetical protein VJ600_09985 [Holophagaceae bacterium]|nr:hypothetical protein [Holophagaceae bacterium]